MGSCFLNVVCIFKWICYVRTFDVRVGLILYWNLFQNAKKQSRRPLHPVWIEKTAFPLNVFMHCLLPGAF